MRRVLIAVMSLCLAACASEFDPPSLLSSARPRVLAIEVAPLEVGPGDQVTLTPYVFVPEALAAPTLRWRFCPLTAGPQGGYACVSPRCEVPLTADGDGLLRADPTALALACVDALGASAGGGGAALPDVESIEMVFHLEVVTETETQEAIARLPYYPKGAPEPRNRAPQISAVRMGGVASSTTADTAPLPRGGTLAWEVETDAASLDDYIDALDRPQREEALVSFFVTAGALDADRATGLVARTTLDAVDVPSDLSAVTSFVVVRDGRGGQAVRGPFRTPLR